MSDEIFKDFEKASDVSEELIEKYKSCLPQQMISIWQEYGFGAFREGFFKLINPEEYQELVEESYFAGKGAIPILATGLGDILTWERGEFIGLIKYRYSDFDVAAYGMDFFFKDTLNEKFINRKFSYNKYQKAVEKHGELAYNECFYYVPLLALGGRESVNNLKKIKITDHIHLVKEMTGGV